MCEGYFRSLCTKAGIAEIVCTSAGVCARSGEPASVHAQTVLRSLNPEAPTHCSQPVSEKLMADADLIVALTSSHRSRLLALFPDAGNKIHLLKDFPEPGASGDVADPFGGNEQTYRECFEEMKPHLEALFNVVKNKITQ